MKKKRGPGRPPLPPGERKSVRVPLRLDVATTARLDEIAAALGEDRTGAIERLIWEWSTKE